MTTCHSRNALKKKKCYRVKLRQSTIKEGIAYATNRCELSIRAQLVKSPRVKTKSVEFHMPDSTDDQQFQISMYKAVKERFFKLKFRLKTTQPAH